MLDLTLAANWIYGTLTADATIAGIVGTRVYRDFAPQGAAMPAIIYQFQSSEDLNTAGVNRIFTAHTVIVKAVDSTGSYGGNLATLAGRIDALMHNVNARVTVGADSGYVWAWRIRPFNLAEVSDGVQYRHFGGVYRVHAQVY